MVRDTGAAEKDHTRPPALLLFDIDGTLLRGATIVHKEGFAHAYRTIYGLSLNLDGVAPAGRTDTWLLAEPLRQAGVDEAAIWQKMPAAFHAIQEYVDANLGDLRAHVLPGVPELLHSLHERGYLLGLLTGNLSRVALAKMRHAGLARYFDSGGFGEESEVRAHLVPVAMAAASALAGVPVAARHTVVIGDTLLDVEAGKSHGTRTVAVATGTVSEEMLRRAEPDLLLSSFEDHEGVAEALERLIWSP